MTDSLSSNMSLLVPLRYGVVRSIKPQVLTSQPGLLRAFHQSLKPKSTMGVESLNQQITPPTKKADNSSAYLSDLKPSELFSYFCIGVATLNKPILQACIKMFPYVPLSVIKALVYKIYCGGENIQEVKQTGARLTTRGINNMMISLTIEACNGNDNIDPQYIVEETAKSVTDILVPHTLSVIENSGKPINSIPPGYVALKPTGFAKNAADVLQFYNTTHAQEFELLVERAANVCQTIYDSNVKLAEQYPERTAPFVVGVVDAEKYDLQPGVYELQRRLYEKFNPVDKPVSVVGTLQMYLADSAALLTEEQKLAEAGKYRLGLKLVRGAYIHSEPNRAVIHATKTDTDNNYNQGISYCIDSILANKGNESTIGHLVVASHNGDSLKLATTKLLNVENNNRNNVVLGQLLGMADNITYNLIKSYNADNVIKYVPWGPPLETKEYLLRRLEENGDAVRSDNGFPLIKAVVSVIFKRLFRLA